LLLVRVVGCGHRILLSAQHIARQSHGWRSFGRVSPLRRREAPDCCTMGALCSATMRPGAISGGIHCSRLAGTSVNASITFTDLKRSVLQWVALGAGMHIPELWPAQHAQRYKATRRLQADRPALLIMAPLAWPEMRSTFGALQLASASWHMTCCACATEYAIAAQQRAYASAGCNKSVCGLGCERSTGIAQAWENSTVGHMTTGQATHAALLADPSQHSRQQLAMMTGKSSLCVALAHSIPRLEPIA
jgi:hypothetical protein